MLSQAQKKILHIGDVKEGVDGEDDGIVEVGSDGVDDFADLVDDLVDDLDEPPWSSAVSLWHNQPHEETRGCAESGERYRVLVHFDLMKRRNELEEEE